MVPLRMGSCVLLLTSFTSSHRPSSSGVSSRMGSCVLLLTSFNKPTASPNVTCFSRGGSRSGCRSVPRMPAGCAAVAGTSAAAYHQDYTHRDQRKHRFWPQSAAPRARACRSSVGILASSLTSFRRRARRGVEHLVGRCSRAKTKKSEMLCMHKPHWTWHCYLCIQIEVKNYFVLK